MEKSTWSGGHSNSVLCLDTNREGILASGGEDELCIWSSTGIPQTKIPLQNGDSKEVNSVCFCTKNPERLYAACGNKVFCYDLRNLSTTVCEFDFNEDEINQVATHDKGAFIAACDDSGEIKVIDVQSKKLFKSLNGKHENICSTVQFRPSRPWEVLSGGLDSRVVSWDFSSGRALQEVDMQSLEDKEDTGAYLVNPPFAHSIHMAGNGRSFAAGLGDGSIQLFQFEGKKTFAPTKRLRKHVSSVSQVHFPRFDSNDLLVSGGNDCRLILWNIHSGTCNGASSAAAESGHDSAPSVVSEVELGSKPNWISSGSGARNVVYVADQTNDISVYHVV